MKPSAHSCAFVHVFFAQVWKKEQQAEAEKKRVEELRAQYEEERKNQEFLDIAHQAGHGK